MKIFYLILLILFAFFIVTFSQYNAEPVRVQYFNFIDLVVPGYMLIFAALLIGIIITWFLGSIERFQLNRTISKQNKTIRDLRKELRATTEPPPIIEEEKKTT